MQTVPRPAYLAQLLKWRDRQLIKVVSGVRRCGKSTLLRLFADQLITSGVSPDRIITINFEDLQYEHLKDYHQLHQHIVEHLSSTEMTYVFLDEVQEVDGFERAVDSLYLRENVDLYLTGSNAYFMSGELSTLLTGRFIEITMLPLSFAEYCVAVDVDTRSSAVLSDVYRNYVSQGAFPFTLSLADDPAANYEYLRSIYNSILLKDIVARHHISDVMLIEDVTRYLLDNVGNIVSPTRIANTLTSAGRASNQRTIEKYVTALTQSLLFYESQRFDIKGKRMLTRLEKYYAVDMGLRYAMLGGRGQDVGHILENVVYLELIRRGFEAFVGQFGQTEIDFVATRAAERLYVQVSATIRDPTVLAREIAPLRALPDSYPKFILTLDDDPDADHDGIRCTNAIRWLLET